MNINRSCRMVLSALLMLLTVASVCPAQSEDRDDSATPEEIAAAIEEIQAAERVRDASAAYASLARRAPDNAALRFAYIKRLIQLGSPDVAYSAAGQLVAIDPNNVFALGVLGYCQGRRREYANATGCLARAAQLGATDEATMENLGQLIAHMELDPSAPTLPDEIAELVSANKAGWSASEAYQRGHNRIAVGHQSYTEAESTLTAKLAAIEAEGQAKEDEIRSLQADREVVLAARQQLQTADQGDGGGGVGGQIGPGDADSGATTEAPDPTNVQQPTGPNAAELQANYERESQIIAAITEIEAAIRQLKTQHRTLAGELAQLPRMRGAIVREVAAEFTFVPPADPGDIEVRQVTVLQPLASPVTPDQADETAIIIDNEDVDQLFGQGEWIPVAGDGLSHGPTLLHDNNANKGANVIGFVPELPAAGEYDVYLFYPAADFAATNVPVEVVHAEGSTTVTVDQRTTGGEWLHLGTFTFHAGNAGGVVIRTDDTDGTVLADAAKFQAVADTPAEDTTVQDTPGEDTPGEDTPGEPAE